MLPTLRASWRGGDFAYEVGRGRAVRARSGGAVDTTRTKYIRDRQKDADGAWRVSRDFTGGAANGASPGLITAIGTDRETADSAGVMLTNHWRWAGVMRQQGDGQ